MGILLIPFFLIVFSFTSLNASTSVEKLFYYGEPALIPQTGFIKINPQTDAWEPAAPGFATVQNSVTTTLKGVLCDNNGVSIVYGQFPLWNGIYVGCMLKLDLRTMQPSVFNSGVLGQQVRGMTYFNNNSQVALIGFLSGIQENPNIQVNQVAACTTNGQNCFSLGSGLEGYSSAGTIRSVGKVLYALYQAGPVARVASFNTSSIDPEESWPVIYEVSRVNAFQFSIEVFMDSLWLFGTVITEDNQTVSAARWNSVENSWEFINSSHVPPDASMPIVSISPNGQSLYIVFNPLRPPIHVYKWNYTIEDWDIFYTPICTYQARIAALNDGVIIACSPFLELVPVSDSIPGHLDSYLLPHVINCSLQWVLLSTNQDNSHLYAFCVENASTIITVSYDLTSQVTVATGLIQDLQHLSTEMQMCVYGEKIFIGGKFQTVGNTSAVGLAVWDNHYQKWYSFPVNDPLYCVCDTDGKQLAAVCTMQTAIPIVVLDSASSDSGNGNVIQNIEIFPLFELESTPIILQVDLLNETLYIGGEGAEHLTLSQWTADKGLQVIEQFCGGSLFFQVVNNIAYIGGNFDVDNETVVTARYSLLNNTWLPMDQLFFMLYNTTTTSVVVEMRYWNNTNKIYAAGIFNKAENLRVSNWVGYDLDMGQAVDTVGGGVGGFVKHLQPIGDQMFLVEQYPGCDPTTHYSCQILLGYNALNQLYSPVIARGVIAITTGYDQQLPPTSSPSDQDFIEEWESIIGISAGLFILIFTTCLTGIVYRKMWNRRHQYYAQIHELKTNYTDPFIVDFARDDFVLKSVLGRGAYGTIWTCTFPHRASGTYAVKQMLFSKGDEQLEIVKKEISILEKFRHPHIVHYCGHRMEESSTSVEIFIFMEYYEQPCSLKGVIQKRIKKANKTGKKRRWFTYPEVKKFLLQMLEGLNFLHNNRVAHRDLKCANILIRAKENVVYSLHISDFGISRVMPSGEGKANALTSTVTGTPSFMAPELFKNQPYEAFKADIWSFGMTLYEILVWKEPEIPGKKPEFPEEVREFLKQDRNFDGVVEIFDMCVQQEPDSRPTVSDLLFFGKNLP